MASTATLPPSDILTPRLPAHPMSGMYHPSARSPVIRNDRPVEYGGHPPHHSHHPHSYPNDRHAPRDPAARPRENVRYEPYPDNRRRASGRDQRMDDKIVLPPPSLGGVRLPDDPNAPRHVLPSIQQNSSSWGGNEGQQGRPVSRAVQLPSLRTISVEPSPVTRTASSSAPQYDRPLISPRDPYRPAVSPHPPYNQPAPPPSSHYDQPHHSQHRSQGYPYPHSSAPPPRKTHPPPIQTHPSPPMRVKYEPDPSPPLRSAPLPVLRSGEPYYPSSSSPRYSPGGHRIMEYADARRGSVISMAGAEGKEQMVGQTRRLAHLMSEQKRRESINSGFTALRSALPLALPTDSKAVILRKALARIEQLEHAAGILPRSGRSHGYAHSAHAQGLPDSETSTHTSRSDWRSGGSMMHPRMDDRTTHSHSSASSRQMREPDLVGRYDDEWVDRRREVREYADSPRSEMGYAAPYVQPMGERVVSNPREPIVVEGESKWNQEEEEEEEMDGGSVYSQERAPSRESLSHVR